MKRKIILSLGIALAMVMSISAFAKDKVLVIESYHSTFQWDMDYLQGLKDTIGKTHEVVTFQMDTKRVPKSDYQKMADLAWNKYQEIKPKLVFLGDDNALKYLGPKFEKTNTPVVFLGVNKSPLDYIKGGKNVTGILERPLLKKSVPTIRSVFKESGKKLKKVLILFDSGTTSQASVKQEFAGKTTRKIAGITVDLKLIGQFEEWQKTVNGLANNGYDAVVIGLYHTLVDASGKNVPAGKVLGWTSQNTKVPPFCFWSFAVGKDKAIGGEVLYGVTQGQDAGNMALEILGGKNPKSIRPKIGEKGRFLYSKTLLKRFGLKLPGKIASKASYTEDVAH